MKNNAEFDCYAESYDRTLNEGLAVSGESRQYFAEARVKWLADCLLRLRSAPSIVIDYGCGTGSTSPLLLKSLTAKKVIGIDASVRSIEVARREFASERVQFSSLQEFEPEGDADLVYCNGVFHHIPPEDRSSALQFVDRTLRPGGLFSLWENNPWNPGTQYVMARLPFDRDAIKLSAVESRRLVQSERLSVLRTDFVFFFPRFFKILRPFEKFISGLPFGAQYQILCRKPMRSFTGSSAEGRPS
ncbi:MAG: class I SAM-dependent methyltransferase [Terriglobales bacterium]